MASKFDSKSHYTIGADLIEHKGKVTKTIVTNEDANEFVRNLDSLNTKVGFVTPAFENRPDLISEIFYNTPRNWWFLCMINNMPDPFEGFKIDDRIFIPIDVI